MHRLVWAVVLLGTVNGSAFADVKPVDSPPYEDGVSRWYCDGADIKVRLAVTPFETIAGSRSDIENRENGGPNACAATLYSFAYAFTAASAGAWTFAIPDPDARRAGSAGRCCHAARERFTLDLFNLIFENSGPVPEPPTPSILLFGFASIGLAAYRRAIRNRAATAVSSR